MATSVSIIGTGDFGRALGARLVGHGYAVTYGSRVPHKRHLATINPQLTGATITTVSDAIAASDVIFVCIHSSAHASLEKYRDQFQNKILVDVSNVEDNSSTNSESNAERLSRILPGAYIVKAFNTQSAYKIENVVSGEGNIVYVASDFAEASERVLQIVRTCAFIGVHYGGLNSASRLEAMPLELCGDWLVPLIITLVTSSLWFLYIFLHYYIVPEDPKSWDKFPANVLNKFYGVEAITLLALCYIPGSFAAIAQIINGSKYKRFPTWLDLWLKARKQLGLMALTLAAIHCCLSVAMLNSSYYDDLFLTTHVVVPANATQDTIVPHESMMNWQGETLISVGAIALTLMAVLGITSIPAVGNLLNWRQWVFVQSYLGFLTLLVAETHVMVRGTPGWSAKSIGELATSMTFMSSMLPYLAIALRLVLLLPCINSYVWKIRKGWERVPNEEVGGVKPGAKRNAVHAEEGTVTHMNGYETKTNGYVNETVISEL